MHCASLLHILLMLHNNIMVCASSSNCMIHITFTVHDVYFVTVYNSMLYVNYFKVCVGVY
jgi:hypothetical protein